MADKLSLNELRKFLPTITRYCYNIARTHRLLHGRGVPISVNINDRLRVNHAKLEHFISFITSPHIIQDVPFGEKIIKLSTGEAITTPNVIRTMIPERIVQQNQQYSSETSFTCLSRSTLHRTTTFQHRDPKHLMTWQSLPTSLLSMASLTNGEAVLRNHYHHQRNI